MENNLSKMKLKFHLKSKALLVIGKENIHIKKNILNNIKLKSKLKFSLNKEIKTKQDIKEESKESIFIPFAPKIKKQILRNHKNLKKIPSTNCIHTSSKNKIKLIQTMNYSLREENDKKNTSLTNTTFQENNIPRVKSLKHIKNHFFSTHLILPKPYWFHSGVRLLDKSKNKTKNTISEIPSLNKGNTSNNNTTANTHKNSNKKNISNSFKKCKINLKTLTRKNSYIKNNNNKIKRSNICPVRNILNRNNSNINITKEESKNNINNFMSKTQFHYDIKNIEEKNNKKEGTNEIKELYINLLTEEKENELNINSSYFSNQPEINEKMRAILIDWLIDVNNKFNFREETLFITINIIDSYLSKKKIKRCNLQLLGVTALFIACKQNEIIFRRLKEYAYITDNAYDINDILNMEKDILKTLNFNILFPSSLSFFELLCNNFNIINQNKESIKNNLKYFLGMFLIQSFYMSEKCLKYFASTIACSAMYIVMKFFKIKNYKECYDKKLFNIKNKNNEKNNAMNIVKECAKDICNFVGDMAKNNLNATIMNFSNDKYGNISKLVFGNIPFN